MKKSELKQIIKEEVEKLLIPRRSKEERQKNYQIALRKKIEKYMKDGGEGSLDLENTPLAKRYSKEE